MPDLLWILVVLAALPLPAARAQDAPPSETPQATTSQHEEVRVTAPTPVDGMPVDSMHFPGNIQHLSLSETDRVGISGTTDLLNRSLASVHLSDPDGNALEPDIFFRGFQSSGILGTPQGLSVYQDGVRLNETFGDSVHWAFTPPGAIASIDLLPGSDPLFGQNTIGGAVSIHTRTGFSDSGTTARFSGGSFGQTAASVETGGRRGFFGWFVAGDVLQEDGWRADSPARLARIFATASERRGDTEIDLTAQVGSSRILANGTVPESLLSIARDALFTRPDIVETRNELLYLRGRTPLSESTDLVANLSARWIRPESTNGDATPFFPCDSPSGFLCGDGPQGPRVLVDQNGKPVPSSGLDAVFNRTSARESTWAATLQIATSVPLWDRPNRLVAGFAAEDGQTHYDSSVELAAFDGSRAAVASGIFDLGSSVRLDSARTNIAAFFADSLSMTQALTLTIGGRFDRSRIALSDQIGTALNGRHVFSRFDPTAGLSWQISKNRAAFAGYNEGFRAPTPVELTCADPDAPCRLPNAFVSDPPLHPVVARTLEAGVRGQDALASWSLAVFRTTTDDDIAFIGNGAERGDGHFDNVGRTRRQGVEMTASHTAGAWTGFLDYSLLDARFESGFAEESPDHPDAIGGVITVARGDRISALPVHNVKAGARVRLSSHWTAGADATSSSGQYLRGDEANRLAQTRTQFRVNLDIEYRAGLNGTLFARLTNVFDRRDVDFGQVGRSDLVLRGTLNDYRFVSPTAPRMFQAGFRVRL